jgi:hypothetical protein
MPDTYDPLENERLSLIAEADRLAAEHARLGKILNKPTISVKAAGQWISDFTALRAEVSALEARASAFWASVGGNTAEEKGDRHV